MENPILREKRLNKRPHWKRRICPVCKTHRFDEVGAYEVCPICGWEDDPVQRRDPDFAGGANALSLNEAREKYLNEKKEDN